MGLEDLRCIGSDDRATYSSRKNPSHNCLLFIPLFTSIIIHPKSLWPIQKKSHRGQR